MVHAMVDTAQFVCQAVKSLMESSLDTCLTRQCTALNHVRRVGARVTRSPGYWLSLCLRRLQRSVKVANVTLRNYVTYRWSSLTYKFRGLTSVQPMRQGLAIYVPCRAA